MAFASHARFIVEQSERVHSTLGSAHLSAVKSIVRWRQCTSYVLQPVCRPLFLVLLLFCEPAVEKSEVVGYKELTLNWVFKNKSLTPAIVCFSCFVLWSLKFIYCSPFPMNPCVPYSGALVNQLSIASHISHPLPATYSQDLRRLPCSTLVRALLLLCDWKLYTDRYICGTRNPTSVVASLIKSRGRE